MIANEKQYRITKAALAKFEKAHRALREEQKNLPPKVHPKLQQAHVDATQSYIEELSAQIADYDALRQEPVELPELAALAKVPRALIRARIAAGMTQKELAQKLGLKEQQVQRYEASEYAGASLRRVREIAQVFQQLQRK